MIIITEESSAEVAAQPELAQAWAAFSTLIGQLLMRQMERERVAQGEDRPGVGGTES